jgi:hypothetical protein
LQSFGLSVNTVKIKFKYNLNEKSLKHSEKFEFFSLSKCERKILIEFSLECHLILMKKYLIIFLEKEFLKYFLKFWI